MLSHPDSVIAFGLLRHQELQAENIRIRKANAAVPSPAAQLGALRRIRSWLSLVFIRMGTSLQVETREPGAPRKAFPANAS